MTISSAYLFNDNNTYINTFEHTHTPHLKFSIQNERKFLKIFLLSRLHQLFYETFRDKIQADVTNITMEYFKMDSKIIQVLIHRIVEKQEYTLEGIAHYTRIPFDVIFDAACGNTSQLSITSLARIMALYTQVFPEIANILFDKLLEMKGKSHFALSLLLNEK